MRAVTYTEFGGIDKLRMAERPMPKIGPLSVLVKVVSASINPVDFQIREGLEQEYLQTQFPISPGLDVAGVVVRLGADTPEFQIGDEIIGHAMKDVVTYGTLAEYVELPVRSAAHKPAALSFDEAATLPLASQTALQSVDRAAITSADTVLIHGAAGGVGVFGTQIAVRTGARVIGTASPRNHDFLRSFGAEPIDYRENLVAVARAAAPDGYDVVLDYAGRSSLASTPHLLRDGGRVVSIADPDAREVYGGHFVWLRPNTADLNRVAQMVADGDVKVEIAAIYDLPEFADAFTALQSGTSRGKIVVRVGQPFLDE
ncbi:NADP-dependent oxidoreductase [Microbacterium caowuchunii]|uniref:NADP-dependent oxidoreductase n=1 Tax=Microbacterium caowuchunii TaxID=2614638 RepID=A0A5N0TP04_9MICO|nr:NADP-dependent oxidoreductase [Microbacterium caowuchunii]KAA9135968.1 NADP-dependent oxidoreductase [Microbacterium caowuchunii]